MTTSNPTNGSGGPNGNNGVPNSFLNTVPNGLPDESLLTQLANEMFKALPGLTQNPGDLASAAQKSLPAEVPNIPHATGIDSLVLPNEAELRQLPARMSIGTGAPLPQGANSLSPSVVPVGFNATDLSSLSPESLSSLGFLNEIRPLFSYSQIEQNAASSAYQQPGIGSYPQTDVAALNAIGAPQVPGTVAHANGVNQFNQLNYPEQAQFSESQFNQQAMNSTDPLQVGQMDQFMTPGTVGQFNQASPFQQPFSFDYQNPLTQAPRVDVVPVLAPFDRTASGGIGNLNLSSAGNFDVEAIRRDFPILQERVNGHQLVWLDNAATTQKPNAVIDRLSYFYSHENSNIHRAAHALAARATDAYEAARESVRRFLNAPSVQEIVFARGATEAINLVAQSWGKQNIQKDDEIVISWLEHHANIVPWQMLCAEKGARLRVAPVDNNGQILLDQYERLLGPKTKLVSITQVSNALGTVTPIKSMVDAAHRYGARVLVDGAQAVSHMQIDVQSLDCDFYVFSGHKVYAPTGIGVLFGKAELLESMPPWQGGGNMIKDVTFERTLYQNAPLRFEAGTGSIGDAVGLGAAIDYVQRIGMANIGRHENELLVYATEGLKRIPGLKLIGTAPDKAGVLSFVLDGYRTEEVSEALNREGIAVRAGHHCAQPILRRFGQESTVRPSLGIYNTCQDIDALIAAVWNLRQGRNPGLL
jgi:cysteine desulfurase/selenocysteine lyase